MNNKGFTTIELIVSFVMVIAILASLIGFAINYRDRITVEEVKTQLIDYKNTITKMIYDDIMTGKLISVTSCVGTDACANFVDRDNVVHPLMVVEENNILYLSYDGVKYMLPDSDLNKIEEKACYFSSFIVNTENNICSVKINFHHYLIEDNFEINLMIV